MFFEEITPIEKLHEILCNAAPELCTEWLESALLRLAACELALEDLNICEDTISGLSSDIRTIKLANSLAIDAMATILSQNG